MENRKDHILMNIAELQNELNLEKLLQNQLMEKISTNKAHSLIIGEEAQTLKWKLSQAEFIYLCENERRCAYLNKIERSKKLYHKFFMTNNSEPNFTNTSELKRSLTNKLEVIQKSIIEKKELISKISKELDSLKKRNNDLMENLMQILDEAENQERALEDSLE